MFVETAPVCRLLEAIIMLEGKLKIVAIDAWASYF